MSSMCVPVSILIHCYSFQRITLAFAPKLFCVCGITPWCIELWHANVKGKTFQSTKFLIMRFDSIFCRPTCKKDDEIDQ